MYAGIVIASLGIIIAFFTGFFVTRRRKAIEAADPLVTGHKREQLNEGKTYRQIPYPVEDITDVAFFYTSKTWVSLKLILMHFY